MGTRDPSGHAAAAVAALFGLVVTGCAARAGAVRETPAPAPPEPRDHVEEIEDVDDRCPALPRECLEGHTFIDDDGCPDPPAPRFALPRGAPALPDGGARSLDWVAMDVRHLIAGARLLVTVERAPDEPEEETRRRTALVAEGLRARGVPDGRVTFGPPPPEAPIDPEDGGAPPDRVVIRVTGCAP